MKVSNSNYKMSKTAKRVLATITDPAAKNALKRVIIAGEVAENDRARSNARSTLRQDS